MSETKQLAIRATFNTKTIQRAAAIIGETLTEEQIDERLVNIEPLDANFDEILGEGDNDSLAMCMAFVSMLIESSK